jgi:hypothetical protein
LPYLAFLRGHLGVNRISEFNRVYHYTPLFSY